MTSDQTHKFTAHLSDQSNKLKILLQRDDERRRKQFIRNLSEKHTNGDKPPKETLTPLVNNQASVEYQLQEQVNFYENALAKLQERSNEISEENKKLYETMNKSVVMDAGSSDEEDSIYNDTGKFSSSRPKERLLRTKAEFKSGNNVKSVVETDDSLGSMAEPGQVTTPTNYKFNQRGSENNIMYDMDDASIASEPGQVIEVVNHNGYSNDINETRNVTFNNNNNSSLPEKVVESTGHSYPNETKQTQNMINDFEGSFQPTGISDHGNLQEEMKRMQDLYETKTKHLDGLLQTARKQIEGQQIEITNLKGELRVYKTPIKEDDMDVHNCGILKTSEKKLVQQLLLEREELLEAIKRQQAIVAEGNRHETEAYYHVKKSCEMVEQVQLEKQEAVVRVKQLMKDLDEYKEKNQNLQKCHHEEIITISRKTKQDMDVTVEALNKKVEEQALGLSVLQNHIEKCIREKMNLKNELDKFEKHNLTQQSTSSAMIEESQKEVMEALKRQTLAEHETGQIRLDAKLREKRKQQEVEQLCMEVNELKRRLHVTEENLNISQKNQLDITNQLNFCKQQLQQEVSQRKMMIHTFEDERKRLECDANQREQDLSQVIQETDKCYQLAKEELTRMLDSQTQIVSRYQNECKELSEKVSVEQRQHQLSIGQLMDKCHKLETSLKEMFEKEQKRDVILDSYRQQTENTEQELKQKKELVMMLMSKQSAILRDRYLLSKEVELLRSQLHTGA